jgi:hypothetical protein
MGSQGIIGPQGPKGEIGPAPDLDALAAAIAARVKVIIEKD